MTRQSLYKKDKLYRKNFLKKELNNFKYKLIKNIFISDRSIYIYSNLNLKNKSYILKIRNRCLFNNCSKSVLSKYKLNRITLREQILKGNIIGVSKAKKKKKISFNGKQ